jgi:ribosome-associated toxin RatA of RatAB toxin-antitoxin module
LGVAYERARVITSVVLGSLLAFPGMGDAAQISVDTTRHGDSFEVRASAQIDAGMTDAWKVLTDYDGLADFIPGMKESRVISRNGPYVVVEQRGEANLLFLTFPMYVRLAIEEFPYVRIVSKSIAGNFKELHGAYYLQARAGGMTLRYEGNFTPDFGIPPFIATLVVRNTVEKRFVALVREIEKTRDKALVPAVK